MKKRLLISIVFLIILCMCTLSVGAADIEIQDITVEDLITSIDIIEPQEHSEFEVGDKLTLSDIEFKASCIDQTGTILTADQSGVTVSINGSPLTDKSYIFTESDAENGSLTLEIEYAGYTDKIWLKVKNPAPEVQPSTSGTCGPNLTWEFDATGTLTISGSGDMYDFVEISPWEEYMEDITKVVFEDTVTSVGEYAFEYCKNLTEVVFPTNLVSIAAKAFIGCESLTEITFPFGTEFIADSAFWGCTNLTKVTFPSSIVWVGGAAFANVPH